MNGVNSGPVPSKKVFLYEIPQLAVGTKIRFLGCVTSYQTESAALTLAHYYPKELPKAGEVVVDIQLLLESVGAHELESGCWLNVIGYVRRPPRKRKRKQDHAKIEIDEDARTTVQAIMLWSAGALNIAEYESVLEVSKLAVVGHGGLNERSTA